MYYVIALILLAPAIYGEIVTSQGGFSSVRCAVNAAGISAVTVESISVKAYLYGPLQ